MHYVPPANNGLNLVYHDDALLVLDKPAGLLSVPGRGEARQDCLAARVQMDYPEALIVHRLDMATSGLLVLARGAEMHRHLSKLFQERRVKKRYIALVAGHLLPSAGQIELPLICDWPNRPRQIVDLKNGKPAQTRYRTLAYDPAGDASRVELSPRTGRSHQLRVHMQALGHPILGDELYGDPARGGAARLMLHAEYLTFEHPATGKAVEFTRAAPF